MLIILLFLRRVPRPIRLLALAALIGLVIASLAHTFSVYRYTQERQQHVHPRRITR